VAATPGWGAQAEEPWPPAQGPGWLFVHYGEEHLDDLDGARIFPKVIEETARYRPRVVIASGDKTSDGTVENLKAWKAVMEAYDRARVPYFAGVGNHDRKTPPGIPEELYGTSPIAESANYLSVYADRPYPFGDGTPYSDPLLEPRARPAGDPTGASTHYWFDYGPVRWIIIDNGCFGIVNCDAFQNPTFPDAEGHGGQYAFMAAKTAEAKARGMKVFVAMHMPTRDPRPNHSQPTPSAHNMGEGISPDNTRFEREAAALGVDGVFVAHIKGVWEYAARGVPYYIDGGAGGEVYVGSGEQVGVDSGYWHGYRLVWVLPDGQVLTDQVPVFVPGGITVKGPSSAARRSVVVLSATGRQPTQEGPMVDKLEIRDPARGAPNWDNLPIPARVWTTTDADVLEPVRDAQEDPRSNPSTQTRTGRFRAVCPGRAAATITAGWETASAPEITVPSVDGRILRSVTRRRRSMRRGRDTALATVRLAQHAQVHARVRRGRRTVAELLDVCRGREALGVRWDGRTRGSSPRRVARGRYTLEVRVLSDRAPVVRRLTFRVR
jgi:hypothetical protein